MTDVNLHTIEGFGINNFYEPALANAGLFNPTAAGGATPNFVASVMFKLRGSAMPIGGVVLNLWGSQQAGQGWGLGIGPTGGVNNEIGIIASNLASAGDEAMFPIAQSPAGAMHPGLVERVIVASLVYDGTLGAELLHLVVNGEVVASVAQVTAYVNAVVSPRLGVDTVAPAAAEGLEIAGAAFLRTNIAAGGLLLSMGNHYKNCRAAMNMALLLNERDVGVVDFQHRWNARDVVTSQPGRTARGPNAVKTVFGYDTPRAAIPDASALIDTGNRGFVSNAAEPQVPLIATSGGPLSIVTTVNPDWHVSRAVSLVAPA